MVVKQGTDELQARSYQALWPILVALFIFAFTFRSSSGAYLVGMIWAVLWYCRQDNSHVPALPQTLLKLCKIYLFLLALHSLWTLWHNEYSLRETLEGYRHFIELLLFVPFSVVFYHCRRYLLALLWVPVLAVVVRIIHRSDFSSLDTTLFHQSIYGFGQHHVTFGMQAMLTIIALVSLTPLTLSTIKTKPLKVITALSLLCGCLLITQALMTSGSRSAWACLVIGLAVLMIAQRHRLPALANWKGALLITLAIIGIANIVNSNYDKIHNRLVKDTQTNFNFSLSAAELPRDHDVFFARRVHLAHFGLEKWQQRPWLGHGPASVEPLLDQDPDFHIHPHLHNTYIQVIMELGVVTTIALVGVIAWLIICLWRCRHEISQNPFASTVNQMLAASSISLSVWSVGSFHLHSSDWRFIFVWYTSLAALLVRQYYFEPRNRS